jgi:CRP/FNR family transcriptional regulator, cyclic AMP receptor protein
VSSCPRRRFRRGEVVFHQGDTADALHIVLRGVFAADAEGPLGSAITVRLMRAGDYFGELALLDGPIARSATVSALENGETRRIDRRSFDNLRASSRNFDHLLIQALAMRVRDMTDLLVDVLFMPVEQRVSRRLLHIWQERDSTDPLSWVRMSQQEFAMMVGAARPTVNRALKRLEASGHIELGRSRVRVTDPEGVRRSAGL